MESGFLAPQPQVANFIGRENALSLLDFIELQHQLLSRRPRHRPMFLGVDLLTWSDGQLLAMHCQEGNVRMLTDEESRYVRRIGYAITSYRDGPGALEHCEAMLALLRPALRPRDHEERTDAELRANVVKTVESLARRRGKGVPKRPIFAQGSFVVAVNGVEGMPDYTVSVLRDPGVPRAFRTRRLAERWWTNKRKRQFLEPGEKPIVLEVVRRFELSIRLPRELSRLLLPDLIHTLKQHPDLVSEDDLVVRYLPRLGEVGDDRRRTTRNQAGTYRLGVEILKFQDSLRKEENRCARHNALRDLKKSLFRGSRSFGVLDVDPVALDRAYRLMAPSEAARIGADQAGLFDPSQGGEELRVMATWRGSTPGTGKTSLSYRCEMLVPDLAELLRLGGRHPECWVAFTEGAKARGGARPEISLPVMRRVAESCG